MTRPDSCARSTASGSSKWWPLTREDLQRTATYHARRQSLDARAGATDIPAYLASLEMSASVRPFEPVSFDRITQLINKTNQFNLTTPARRAGRGRAAGGRSGGGHVHGPPQDRFADHGLISVIYGHVRRRMSRDRRLADELPCSRARRRAPGVQPSRRRGARTRTDRVRRLSPADGAQWCSSGITTPRSVSPATAIRTEGNGGGCRFVTPAHDRCTSRWKKRLPRGRRLRHDA